MSHHLQEKKTVFRVCARCGRPLPQSAPGPLCARCEDEDLYHQVKEYVIHNNVTEFEVAEKFQIPVTKVRHWIDEGYLEYKKNIPEDFDR